MINAAASVDIYTEQRFGDCTIELEFMVPKGSNSGVYNRGLYEIQVFDSFGKKEPGLHDCGAIYEVAAPLVNACKAPTIWQSYDIEFQSPKCENGKKTEPARITVYHNGVKIHDDVKIPVDNTRAGLGGDVCQPGPILLQYHGDPVQFRNVWLVPMRGK